MFSIVQKDVLLRKAVGYHRIGSCLFLSIKTQKTTTKSSMERYSADGGVHGEFKSNVDRYLDGLYLAGSFSG
jgi:hypothetical protein